MLAKITKVLLVFVVLINSSAKAHRPVFTEERGINPETAVEIANPEISQVIYRKLSTDTPQLWLAIDAKKKMDLFVQIGVPVIDRLKNYRPSFVVLGPDLPEVSVPFSIPDGFGGKVFSTDNVEPEFFHEHFTKTDSWILKSETVTLPVPDKYYVVSFNPLKEEGKFWISVGDKEEFSILDWLKFGGWKKKIQKFHEVRGQKQRAIQSFTTSANDRVEYKSFKKRFSAGPGVVISDKPYKGMGAETNVFPFIMYQGQNFYLRGPRLGYNIYKNDNLSVEALANWRFAGYEEDDSDDLEGMSDRDMTAELGTSISYKDGFGITRFSFLNDVLGKHDGQLLSLSYGKSFKKDKLNLTPSAGISWQSENFVNYYYGVRSKESTSSRSKYRPSDALDFFMSMQLTYRLNDQWDIFSSFKYQWLDNEISDSPIVDQNYKTSWMFGLIYEF